MFPKTLVRLAFFLLITLAAFIARAQETRTFELTLEFDGQHSSNSNFAFDVAIASESGAIMAMGQASFVGTTGSRILLSHTGRLDRNVRISDVRGIQLNPVSRTLSGTGIGASQAARPSISRVQIKLGALTERQTLVQEEWRFTPSWNTEKWDGSKRVFYIQQSDDSEQMISTIRVQGIVKDSVRKGCRLELRIELVNGSELLWSGGSRIRNGVQENIPIFGEEGYYEGNYVLERPIKRRDIAKIALHERPGVDLKPQHTLAELMVLASYTPDDIDVEDFAISLSANHLNTFVPQVVASERRFRLERFGMWESQRLGRVQRTVPFSAAKHLMMWIYTGDDDLRWDPNAQPNLEFSVTLIYKKRGETRERKDRILGPGFFPDGTKTLFAGYERTSFFWGKFESNSSTAGLLQIRDAIPVEQLVAIEFEMVKGRNPNRQSGGIGRGEDQWDFRGVWIGANAFTEPQHVSLFYPERWSILTSNYEINRKLKLGDKVRIPIDLKRGSILNFPRPSLGGGSSGERQFSRTKQQGRSQVNIFAMDQLG